ncbi:MAG: hypothetical protein Q8S84_03950 [bacterium]|nr:hypothetical protein [bacterium]
MFFLNLENFTCNHRFTSSSLSSTGFLFDAIFIVFQFNNSLFIQLNSGHINAW